MDDRCRPKHCHMPNQRERSPTRSVTQLFAQNTFSKRDYAPRVTGALVSPVQTPINDVWNGKKPFNAEEVSLPSNSRILNTTLPSFLSSRASKRWPPSCSHDAVHSWKRRGPNCGGPERQYLESACLRMIERASSFSYLVGMVTLSSTQ